MTRDELLIERLGAAVVDAGKALNALTALWHDAPPAGTAQETWMRAIEREIVDVLDACERLEKYRVTK